MSDLPVPATPVEEVSHTKKKKEKKSKKPASDEIAAEVPEVPAAASAPVESEAKKAKVEEAKPATSAAAEAPKAEEEKPKVEEKPKDVEEDAPADSKRKKISEKCVFNSVDATLNVAVSDEGMLSHYSQGGMGSLLAGARANMGVKAGRYYYEVKIVDSFGHGGKYDLQLGFSTSKTCLFGGEDGSFLFDVTANKYVSGATKKPLVSISKGALGRLPDTVGILLNRVADSPQFNTISLFVNGERKTEPTKLALPEDAEIGALYPHVIFRNISVLPNMGPVVWKMPSFIVRPIGDAAQADIEKSTVVAIDAPELIIPVGFDTTDYITEFASKHPEFTVVTTEKMALWAERSVVQKPQCCNDSGKMIGNMLRKRKFILKMSETVFAHERKALLSRFIGYKKIAHVVFKESTKHLPTYEKVAFPTDEEGFDEIVFVTPKEACEKALEAWKADCKLRSPVMDLKVGTWYKEKITAFQKLVLEKKKDKDAYTELSQEDYMLINLRAEVHYLIHAFKEDVNDEARPGFATEQFGYYYKKYTQKGFDLGAFKFAKVADMLELIPDTLRINEKDVMIAVLDKETDPISFFEYAETERKERQDRLDAGDENAALGFSANRQKMAAQQQAKTQPTKGYPARIPVPPLKQVPMRAIPVKRALGQGWTQGTFPKRQR